VSISAQEREALRQFWKEQRKYMCTNASPSNWQEFNVERALRALETYAVNVFTYRAARLSERPHSQPELEEATSVLVGQVSTETHWLLSELGYEDRVAFRQACLRDVENALVDKRNDWLLKFSGATAVDGNHREPSRIDPAEVNPDENGASPEPLRRGAFPLRLRLAFSSKRPICWGEGVTIELSSKQLLFVANEPITVGRYLRVSLDWPARLEGKRPLRLIILGHVLQAEEGGTLMAIERHKFWVPHINGSSDIYKGLSLGRRSLNRAALPSLPTPNVAQNSTVTLTP